MPRPREQSSILKKFPRRRGRDRAGQGRQAGRDRDLVRRRGQDRTEEQDHPPLGQTWHTAGRAIRSAHRINLHLRCHLSRPGQRCGARPAPMQHRGDEPASGRDRQASRLAATPRYSSTRPDGICRISSPSRPTSRIVPLPAKCPELTWGDQIQGNSCLRRHGFVLRRQYQIRGPSHST